MKAGSITKANMFTFEDLLAFTEKNKLLEKPFKEVIDLYEQEMNEIWEDMIADEAISRMKEEFTDY